MTLIECLVYLALITLLVSGSSASAGALADASDRIRQEALLLQEAVFIGDLFRDEVRESAAVASAAADVLLLSRDEGTTRFERHDRALVYTSDVATVVLNAPPVEVRAFSASFTGPSELEVRIELASGAHMARVFTYRFYL